MITSLAHVTMNVKDYDEAIRFFTEALGMELRSDRAFGSGYRWTTVGAPGQDSVAIVLHIRDGKAPDSDAASTSCEPTFVFHSDDCRGDVARFQERGVKVTRQPEEVPWGLQAVFEDLYGNTHVLLEPSSLAVETQSPS
jgi:predicted enzyme related to lactoylglutathione lyase